MSSVIDKLTGDRRAHRRYIVVGCLLLVAVWWWISVATGPLLLASPWAVLKALTTMLGEVSFYTNLGITLVRLMSILCLAGCGGLLMAILAVMNKRMEQIFEPFRWMCMTIPPVVVVVVLMFCLGMGSPMIVAFGAGILWPVMYVNVLKGSENLSADLLEMAHVFEWSRWSRIRNLLLPAVVPSMFAGMAQVICSAIRITILAEVIGANEGIGAMIAVTARNLDTARMAAWALVALLISVVMELAVLHPLQRKVYRWKKS